MSIFSRVYDKLKSLSPFPYYIDHLVIGTLMCLVTGLWWLGGAFYGLRECWQYFYIHRNVVGNKSFDWNGFWYPVIGSPIIYLSIVNMFS